MTAQDLKQRVTRSVEAFNRGDSAGYVAAYSRNCTLHGYPPQVAPNYDGLKGLAEEFFGGLPDVRVDIEGMVAEGDVVAARYRMSGTHQGPFLGSQPTGRRIEVAAMTFLRFGPDGLIVERWQRTDDMALLTQLGLLPAAAQV